MTPQRDEHGNLPTFAWPGGYPIFYLTQDNGVLCPTCANTEEEVKEADKNPRDKGYDQWRIVAGDINWEDPSLTCDNCNKRIESAYAEDQTEA